MRKLFFSALCCLAVALTAVSTTHADVVVFGSSTGFQETGGDWQSLGGSDIDGSGGLGTDGFFFAGAVNGDGDFNSVQNNNSGAFDGVGTLPSYVSSVVAGDSGVVGTAFGNAAFGAIDDPTLTDGTDAQSGFWITVGGAQGDVRNNVDFTVTTLAAGQTVRVGVLSGIQQDTNGRWEATSITLSEGANSATVGSNDPRDKPSFVTNPGGIEANGGWVFFDIDSAGTYTVSGTKRLATQGVGFAGLTFDSVTATAIPEPSSLALLGLGVMGLVVRRRR